MRSRSQRQSPHPRISRPLPRPRPPPIALDGIYWIPGPATENSAAFSVDINDQVRITKIFEIRDSNDVTAGYEALVRYALQNLTNKPLTARLSFNGTNSPKPENNRDMPEIVAGFDGGSKTVELQHSPVASLKPDNALDITGMEQRPLLWNGIT